MAMSVTSAGSPSAYGALNGYWGQYGNERLRDYCDTGIEYVTLAFVNESPENSLSNFPGTNFAGHCWAGTYRGEHNATSDLLSQCYWMKEDIPYCKGQGVKILLSIGGVYDQYHSNYEVTTDHNAKYFADFLYGAFGPYDETWEGPRPFDAGADEHTSVDGFDFDIEYDFDMGPYITMIETLRSLNDSMLITAAPQCPTDDIYFTMKDMIQKASFDALFVQFYNNPGCSADNNYGQLAARNTLGFNFVDWQDILKDSDKSQDAKIFVGLPASLSAAGSGYISPEDLKDLVCDYKDKKHFGGISLWDLTRGASNVVDGKTYYQHALDALKYGCDPLPTDIATTSAALSPSLTPTPMSSPTFVGIPTGSHGASTKNGHRIAGPTGGNLQQSVVTVPANSADMFAKTVYTTRTRIATDCPPWASCPVGGYALTETVALYTTVPSSAPNNATSFPKPTGFLCGDNCDTYLKFALPVGDDSPPKNVSKSEEFKSENSTTSIQPSLLCEGDDCSSVIKNKAYKTFVTTITMGESSIVNTFVAQQPVTDTTPEATTPIPTGGLKTSSKPPTTVIFPAESGAGGLAISVSALAVAAVLHFIVL